MEEELEGTIRIENYFQQDAPAADTDSQGDGFEVQEREDEQSTALKHEGAGFEPHVLGSLAVVDSLTAGDETWPQGNPGEEDDVSEDEEEETGAELTPLLPPTIPKIEPADFIEQQHKARQPSQALELIERVKAERDDDDDEDDEEDSEDEEEEIQYQPTSHAVQFEPENPPIQIPSMTGGRKFVPQRHPGSLSPPSPVRYEKPPRFDAKTEYKLIRVKPRQVIKGLVRSVSPTRLPCDQCTLSFSNRDTLKRHKELHRKSNIFQCICEKVFTTQETLQQHQEEIHGHTMGHVDGRRARMEGPPPVKVIAVDPFAPTPDTTARVQCNICFTTFKNNATLSMHAALHANGTLWVCKLCQKSYTRHSAALLQQHFRSCPEVKNLKLCICVTCGFVCKTDEELKTHRLLHGGTGRNRTKLQCLCDLEFGSRAEYLKHLYSVMSKLYKCCFCKKQFKEEHELEQHKTYMHMLNQCPSCKVCVMTEHQLEAHRMLYHMPKKTPGSKTYNCSKCSATFHNMWQLGKHSRAAHRDIRSDKQPLRKKSQPPVRLVVMTDEQMEVEEIEEEEEEDGENASVAAAPRGGSRRRGRPAKQPVTNTVKTPVTRKRKRRLEPEPEPEIVISDSDEEEKKEEEEEEEDVVEIKEEDDDDVVEIKEEEEEEEEGAKQVFQMVVKDDLKFAEDLS